MIIDFIVHSIPVAQPRQRHAIRGRGAKAFVANYTPTNHPVNAFKADCRLACSKALGDAPPFDSPLRLSILAVFPRPSDRIWKKRPMVREYKASKPDGDNLAKSILDALNGLLWRDDSLIADMRITKIIANGDEQPKVYISAETIDWVYDEIKF
jgi:Holliday junction resolvase RusA-like endonuclease